MKCKEYSHLNASMHQKYIPLNMQMNGYHFGCET